MRPRAELRGDDGDAATTTHDGRRAKVRMPPFSYRWFLCFVRTPLMTPRTRPSMTWTKPTPIAMNMNVVTSSTRLNGSVSGPMLDLLGSSPGTVRAEDVAEELAVDEAEDDDHRRRRARGSTWRAGRPSLSLNFMRSHMTMPSMIEP